QEILPGRPVTYPGQNAVNLTIFFSTVGMLGYLVIHPEASMVFYLMVVLSLLNSYAGLAASATGFAIGNNVLIIAGALDGASGFLLSILMSKAMNRSFTNVIFGAFGGGEAAAASQLSTADLTVHSISAEDAALQLAHARL